MIINYRSHLGPVVRFSPPHSRADYERLRKEGVDVATLAVYALTPPTNGAVRPTFWSRNKVVAAVREVGVDTFAALTADIIEEYYSDRCAIRNALGTLIYRCHEFAATHREGV